MVLHNKYVVCKIFTNVLIDKDNENSNHDSNDKDYVPSDESVCCNNNLLNCEDKTIEKSAESYGLNISLMERAVGTAVRNADKIAVQCSNEGTKQNCCLFCNKFYSKLVRHLESVHINEPEVKRFTVLPKKNRERLQIISEIRKKGNFIHNTTATTENCKFVVSRRPNVNKPRNANNFIPCPQCKLYLSKQTFHVHVRRCTGRDSSKNHTMKVLGRRLVPIYHENASTILKYKVLPPLREDIIKSIIRNDELIIIYGNYLCNKYKHSTHHFKMIRAHLRLLARCFITVKNLRKEIENFSDIFNPIFYNTFIESVNIIGRYDVKKEVYLSPKTASTLGTLISDVGLLWISECIKSKQFNKQVDAENFLKVKKANYTAEVNKTVIESQSKIKRHKRVILPTSNDIKKLTVYLQCKQNEALESLKEDFSHAVWRSLAESTLISVQLFNRRRPGEVERIYIDDFNNYEQLSKKTHPETFESLSEEGKKQASRYVRFLIRGKLGRTVPVLLDFEMLECIQTILKYRKRAKVHKQNKYVFGVPSHDNLIEKHLNACHLMRKFAYECKAENPETLKATILRKHIATNSVHLNLRANEITDLANFMGHHEKIHLQHYRQPLLKKDILGISKLLEAAQGSHKDDVKEDNVNNSTDASIGSEKLNDTNLINNEYMLMNKLNYERHS
ncbi:uncharacterized protein [Prorops nasuta]|uniref:uncharacterized protein n=1 Tax=Prorops nasuta TaxID=863751 RepID=UPI0034CEAB81